MFLKGLKLDPT